MKCHLLFSLDSTTLTSDLSARTVQPDNIEINKNQNPDLLKRGQRMGLTGISGANFAFAPSFWDIKGKAPSKMGNIGSFFCEEED
ncbi:MULTISPECIES: hypothetical protein [unclassified Paenibacillus]|uniref:hypothetical protein n=1 Tax=unclassified Paenibacillus TaxID=185978 RepID=UPI00362ADD3E